MLESFLRLIAHISVPGGTAATDGYSLGSRLITVYRRQITIRQQDDKLFLTKLLHQLDHHDQNFYRELLELMRDERTKQFPLAHAGPCRDPFTHFETAWNAASDSQTSSCQLLERKIHQRKSPRLLRLDLQLQRNHQSKSNLGCHLNQPQILMHGSSQQGNPSQISSPKTIKPS
jgi:hypothetical protein